jgi:hypothetical protein
VKDSLERKLSRSLRRVAIAIVAGGTVAAPLAYARSAETFIVVQPTDLPELARQTGQAMLLYDSVDGRTLLYVEQNQGARLAIFDVTDPAHVKSDGSVKLDAPRPFDFVATLGNQAELVRFRQDQTNAILDLHRVKVPTLARNQALPFQGPFMPLREDGFTAVGSHADVDVLPTQDYRASSEDFARVFDVKQVRDQATKRDTGTTFLLTDSGLYLIRRPGAERNKELREEQRRIMYDGG